MNFTGRQSSSQFILRGPDKWRRWFDIIKKQASVYEVWDLIDPSKANKVVLTKPVQPTYADVNAAATGINDLTDSEVMRLNCLFTIYESDYLIYRYRKKDLSSIQRHILDTVSDFHTTILDVDDIATQLAFLEARVKPIHYALEQDIPKQYYEACLNLGPSNGFRSP
ncbi:hypothetical protein QQX98_001439 [Neonectria punicea]|uniref:Uncharacterized protein n=1 Tax=Neonectria punicea TaxID=979145 RepID=A0ABR1HNC2_9HYPO